LVGLILFIIIISCLLGFICWMFITYVQECMDLNGEAVSDFSSDDKSI
jgi:hypothetical protein